MYFAWVMSGIFVQWFMDSFFGKRVGKGLISRLLAKLRVFGKRPFEASRWWGRRIRQLLAMYATLFALYIGPWFDTDDLTPCYVFWAVFIILYLDDYLFGDDDNFKRFWEGVRNRIKWKMELPEPATDPRAKS